MLTKKQKEVLDYVRKYVAKHEIAPSLEEVRTHFRLASVSTAHYYMTKLDEGGYLDRTGNKHRAIALPAFDFGMTLAGNITGIEYISIPLVGAANCGPAELLAEENIEGYVPVMKKLLPRKSGIFAIRAAGKSLNRAKVNGKYNIEEGDIVLIDSEDRTPRNGDYVLSIIDGAANLKKYKAERGQVTLISESTEKWKPIFVVAGDNWLINGKVVGVVKRGKQGR